MKKFLKFIAFYIGIAGTISFSLFILEESFQTNMFGGWGASKQNDWVLMKRIADTMEYQLWLLQKVNNAVGWIQPLSWLSYNEYVKSERNYIDSLKSQILANRPELYVGEKVELSFVRYQKCEIVNKNNVTYYQYLVNGILIVSRYELRMDRRVHGRLIKQNNKLKLLIENQ